MQADRNRTNRPIEPKVGVVNYVLIALLVILPTVFGFLQMPTEMGVIIVACSLSLCFANLNKIQSFKGAGFEAQMREAVQEAYATLEALQSLARPLLRTNIANIAFANRWDGIGKEKEHELMNDLSGLAVSLEMDQDPEITSMRRQFYNLYSVDHLRFILHVLHSAGVTSETVKTNMQPLMERTETYVPPSVPILRNALLSLTAPQWELIEPYILDYEHYIGTHTFRRPEATEELPDFTAFHS